MTMTLLALFLLLTGAFLPSGKEVYSSTGVLFTLNRDSSVKLVATRSSEGPGKASDIFHHRKGRESGTDAKKGSWWCVDMGENYRLVITHYALRHGKKDGESIPRKWQLQGSINGLMWTDLNSVKDPNDPPYFTDKQEFLWQMWNLFIWNRVIRNTRQAITCCKSR